MLHNYLKSVFRYISKERYVIMTKSNTLLSHGDALFKEDNVYYTSKDFFRMFSVPLIKGVDSLVLPWYLPCPQPGGLWMAGSGILQTAFS
jgi:hypothetical protein